MPSPAHQHPVREAPEGGTLHNVWNGRRLSGLRAHMNLRPLLDRLRHRARCVFVLSTGRVGTDTLTHLLDLARDVDAVHEPGPLFLEEGKRAYQDAPLSAGQRRAFTDAYAESRMFALVRASVGHRVYAECSNRLTFLAPLLAEALPRARFIHLYRHPADVVRSGMRRGWYQGHGWDPVRITPRPDDPWAGAWPGWGPFEKNCWSWSATNQFCLEEGTRGLSDERLWRLSTESLFGSDGSVVAERLLAWLGVSVPPRSEIVRVLTTRYNAQESGSFPRWEDWSPDQRATLVRICGKTAEALGYSSWEQGAVES